MPWIQIIPTTSTDHRYRSNNCNAVNHSDISRSTATFDKIVFVVYYCRKFVVPSQARKSASRSRIKLQLVN